MNYSRHEVCITCRRKLCDRCGAKITTGRAKCHRCARKRAERENDGVGECVRLGTEYRES